jgi:hypothetical protein
MNLIGKKDYMYSKEDRDYVVGNLLDYIELTQTCSSLIQPNFFIKFGINSIHATDG